jgi:hypothetical protein
VASESGQAGDLTDVVITPAMLQAGLDRYATLQGEAEASYVVCEIFEAMVAQQKRDLSRP